MWNGFLTRATWGKELQSIKHPGGGWGGDDDDDTLAPICALKGTASAAWMPGDLDVHVAVLFDPHVTMPDKER